MTFPHYIQKAVDLGLLVAEGDRIIDCKKEEVETIMGMARIIEKIQPTTTAKEEDTTDQEAIVLIRVLSSPSGLARELWADLRIAFGVGHGQTIPDNLWSTDVFRAIGREIDLTFTGERDGSLISREVLIRKYAELNEASRSVGIMDLIREMLLTLSRTFLRKTMSASLTESLMQGSRNRLSLPGSSPWILTWKVASGSLAKRPAVAFFL
jgi:hypothetical protein